MKRLLRAKWLKLIFLGFIALILSLPSIAKEANAQGSSPLCAPQPASTPTPMGCCGPVPASPVPATSLSVTRHGILAKGSLVTTSVIGNGRVETTRTFTSKDLLNTYGQPTISWSESGEPLGCHSRPSQIHPAQSPHRCERLQGGIIHLARVSQGQPLQLH